MLAEVVEILSILTRRVFMNKFVQAPQRRTKELIVQADDLGIDPPVNFAIESALNKGRLTSTSSIVVSPYFPDACRIIRKTQNVSNGLHLTFNCENPEYGWRPASDLSKVPSLTTPDGLLYQCPKQLASNASVDDLREEMESQLVRFRVGTEREPSHIDIHMYSCYYDAKLFGAVSDFAKSQDIPLVVVRDVFEFHHLQRSYDIVRFVNAVSSIRIRGDTKICADQWQTYYLDKMQEIDRGLFQITLHPGCYESSAFDDSPFGKQWRNRDSAFLENCDVVSVANKFQINLTNWTLVGRPVHEGLGIPIE
jgi:predicted glycoside hydrolase/deacetylase ChbG (UPF0249 family)